MCFHVLEISVLRWGTTDLSWILRGHIKPGVSQVQVLAAPHVSKSFLHSLGTSLPEECHSGKDRSSLSSLTAHELDPADHHGEHQHLSHTCAGEERFPLVLLGLPGKLAVPCTGGSWLSRHAQLQALKSPNAPDLAQSDPPGSAPEEGPALPASTALPSQGKGRRILIARAQPEDSRAAVVYPDGKGGKGENRSCQRDNTPGSTQRVKEEQTPEGGHWILQRTFPLKKGTRLLSACKEGIKPFSQKPDFFKKNLK